MSNNQKDFTLTLDEVVRQYLLETGKIIPISDEEIDFFEQNLKSEPLPDELKDASFLFKKSSNKSGLIKKLNHEKYGTEYEKVIALAAREGQENLPDELLQQMLNDRSEVEKLKND